MTAYSVTRPEDLDREGGVVVVIPSRLELVEENRRLRADVDRLAKLAAEADRWRRACFAAHDARITANMRLSKAMRVLASIERAGPRTRAAVAAARREVYGRLP